MYTISYIIHVVIQVKRGKCNGMVIYNKFVKVKDKANNNITLHWSMVICFKIFNYDAFKILVNTYCIYESIVLTSTHLFFWSWCVDLIILVFLPSDSYNILLQQRKHVMITRSNDIKSQKGIVKIKIGPLARVIGPKSPRAHPIYHNSEWRARENP